jgi:hypothetical protein
LRVIVDAVLRLQRCLGEESESERRVGAELTLGPRIALAAICDEKITENDHLTVAALVLGGIFLVAACLPPHRKRRNGIAREHRTPTARALGVDPELPHVK